MNWCYPLTFHPPVIIDSELESKGAEALTTKQSVRELKCYFLIVSQRFHSKAQINTHSLAQPLRKVTHCRILRECNRSRHVTPSAVCLSALRICAAQPHPWSNIHTDLQLVMHPWQTENSGENSDVTRSLRFYRLLTSHPTSKGRRREMS